MKKKIYIPPPNFKRQFITRFQTDKDIIAQLRRAEFESRNVSNKISGLFNEPDKVKSAKKIWHFLRTNIKYQAEPKNDQSAKTINRFIVDGIGDCKHYATFAVGVCNALNIPAFFTLVGQDQRVKKPNHAYCTAIINNKRVIIDPCRKNFDDEANYFYRWDYAPIKK